MDLATQINPTTGNITGSLTTRDTLGGISGEDFMKVLIKQLQFQDPLKPMDNEQMVQQMATIRELEMNTSLSNKLAQLTDQQRFGAAAALIGRHVKGTMTDAEGNEFLAEGRVTAIRFTNKGEVILELDSGQSLPLGNLEEVTDATGISATQKGLIVPVTPAATAA
jgi:flagellar basal-body rod modification protein FlgD